MWYFQGDVNAYISRWANSIGIVKLCNRAYAHYHTEESLLFVLVDSLDSCPKSNVLIVLRKIVKVYHLSIGRDINQFINKFELLIFALW